MFIAFTRLEPTSLPCVVRVPCVPDDNDNIDKLSNCKHFMITEKPEVL